MTIQYKNVYLNDCVSLAGPIESKGPLGKYFDKCYSDMRNSSKTFELGEIKMHRDSINFLLKKLNKKKDEIDIHIAGDLLNQIASSNFTSSTLSIPFIGVFAACSTFTLSLALAATLIDSKKANNALVSTSSNNCTAERQFRQPVEYGGPKKKTATFTVTGSVASYLSRKKGIIKVTSSTIGRVIDYNIKDVYNMGAVMAPAAADTIYRHLTNTNTKPSDYDLILTGDLGRYGKDILKEYMKIEYNMTLDNLDDSACMIYDLERQKVNAGGSGPACIALVFASYIKKLMLEKSLRRVLLVATGALLSQTTANEKLTIPAISHAVSLEVLDDIR